MLILQKFVRYNSELKREVADVVKWMSTLLDTTANLTTMLSTMKTSLESLEDGEDIFKLKDSIQTMKGLAQKMQTCSCTLLSRISKLLEYSEIDKNRVSKMEESLRRGENNPFVSYMKQIKRYLDQCKISHKDYSSYHDQVKEKYTTTVRVYGSKEDKSEGRGAIGTAMAAGGIGGGLIGLALTANPPVALGLGVAGAGVAGLGVQLFNRDTNNSEETIQRIITDMLKIERTIATLEDNSDMLSTSMIDFGSRLSFLLDDAKPVDWEVPVEPRKDYASIIGYVVVPNASDTTDIDMCSGRQQKKEPVLEGHEAVKVSGNVSMAASALESTSKCRKYTQGERQHHIKKSEDSDIETVYDPDLSLPQKDEQGHSDVKDCLARSADPLLHFFEDCENFLEEVRKARSDLQRIEKERTFR